ncbi:hypothetical protein AB4Z22_30300, partial [Paenibacillus sp. TAF58]
MSTTSVKKSQIDQRMLDIMGYVFISLISLACLIPFILIRRGGFSFFFYFTTLFNGGLVPWYILMVNYLHMKNTFWSLLLPPLLNVFYIIILRTFLRSIPDAITESAKIDGAGDFTIFIRLILP